jgi:carboxymethylenebutenolidase
MVATMEQHVDTADGPMRLHEARPDGAAQGAVVVVQEAFGVNGHIERVTRRLADEGYHAVAPDLYHRAGGVTVPYGEIPMALSLLQGLTDEGLLVDVDAALDHLRAAGHADAGLGIVGFCFGGRVAFLAAVSRSLGAAVTFYGGGIVTPRIPGIPSLIERAPELKTPWLGLFGDRDESIPVADVERLEAAVAVAPVDTDVVRYPEAAHGFHCDERPAAYNPKAAADGWRRMLAWFGRLHT